MINKNKFVPLVAEFIGTAVLTLAVLSVIGRTSFPFFAALGAGLTVGIMIMSIGKVSGAHLNPAITFGLWTRRKIDSYTAIAYIGSQILGAIVALAVFQYLVDKALSAPAQAFDMKVLVAEGLGAAVFGFGFYSAIDNKLAGGAFVASVVLALMSGVLVASIASAGLINPAVALGTDSFSRAYIFGPLIGAPLGMAVYHRLFAKLSGKI